MESADISWLTVDVAAFVPTVLGALWYSPVRFAATWMRAVGKTPEELSAARTGYAIAAVGEAAESDSSRGPASSRPRALHDRRQLPPRLVRRRGRDRRRPE